MLLLAHEDDDDEEDEEEEGDLPPPLLHNKGVCKQGPSVSTRYVCLPSYVHTHNRR